MDHQQSLRHTLDIIKLLPPNKVQTFINDHVDALLKKDNISSSALFRYIIPPLEINNSDTMGPFINSTFNKESSSYRSPWSNEYYPTISGFKVLPNELRELEIQLNKLVKFYTKIYYSTKAVSSVYIWEVGESIASGFNCAILIKNPIESTKYLKNSFLDSVNIINVKFLRDREKVKEKIKTLYKITSNMTYELNFDNFNDCGFSGSVTKGNEEIYIINGYLDYEYHCEIIGKMFENMENALRSNLDEVYMKRTENVLAKMRNMFIEGHPNSKVDDEVKEMIENIKKLPSFQTTKEEDDGDTRGSYTFGAKRY